jgi:hypothetical protein
MGVCPSKEIALGWHIDISKLFEQGAPPATTLQTKEALARFIWQAVGDFAQIVSALVRGTLLLANSQRRDKRLLRSAHIGELRFLRARQPSGVPASSE